MTYRNVDRFVHELALHELHRRLRLPQPAVLSRVRLSYIRTRVMVRSKKSKAMGTERQRAAKCEALRQHTRAHSSLSHSAISLISPEPRTGEERKRKRPTIQKERKHRILKHLSRNTPQPMIDNSHRFCVRTEVGTWFLLCPPSHKKATLRTDTTSAGMHLPAQSKNENTCSDS